MRPIIGLLLAGAGLLAAPALPHAAAQFPYPTSQPRVSPYQNLFRFGASTANNYYNLVKPEIEFRSSIQQLRRYGGHSAGRFSPSGPRGIGGAILVNQRSYQT